MLLPAVRMVLPQICLLACAVSLGHWTGLGGLAAAEPAVASVRFPSDAGMQDVKAVYGAKGDGVTDDTAALQAAFRANSNKHMNTVYLPAGTYLVSEQVWFEH